MYISDTVKFNQILIFALFCLHEKSMHYSLFTLMEMCYTQTCLYKILTGQDWYSIEQWTDIISLLNQISFP